MGVLNRKTITTVLIVMLSAVMFFFWTNTPARAQDGSVAEQMQSQVQQATQKTQTAPTSPTPDDDYGIGTVAESLKLDGINYYLFVIIAGIGSLIAWLGGILFDLSLSAFTANMAPLVEELGLQIAIGEMWTIVRDIFNLLFIFGLIYAGFRIILDANDSSSKKTIGTIVIAALIINFSLYFTQIVIDFTNVAAYQIHQMIVGNNSTQKHFGSIPVPSTSSQFYLLSGLNEQRSGGGDSIKNEIGAVAGGKQPSDSSSPIGAIALGFIFLIFYSLLGFVFIAAAAMLITRFFALIFWMIFSPILLLGLVLPKMQSQSDKWLKQFFNQALVGPVLVFMIYLSLRALQGLGGSGREPGLMATIIYLMVVIAFLAASLKVAKSFGAYGADRAMSIGNGIRGSVQGFVGRNTLGRMGDAYNRRLEERGVSDKSWRRGIASSLAGSKYGSSYSRETARSSDEKAAQKRARYDQIHGAPIRVPGTSKAIPFTRGKGKDRQGIVQNIAAGGIDMEKAISGASNEQILELLGQYKPGTDEYTKLVANMSASQYEAVMKAKPEEMDDGAKAKLSAQRKTAVETYLNKNGGSLVQNIKNASDAQLKVIGAEDIAKHAADLKQSQFDDIMKSKEYTETEKSNIRTARETELDNRFQLNPATFFTGRKDKDVAKLPKKILVDSKAAPYITGAALKQILHEDTLEPADRVTVRANVTATGNAAAKKWLITPEGRLF